MFREGVLVQAIEKTEIGPTITQYHDDPLLGHPGMERTLEKMKCNRVNWTKMVTDIKDYVAGCIPCQQAKPCVGPTPRSLAPLPVPDGYNAITICMDPYSKEAKFQATMNWIARLDIAQILRDQGLPLKVYSDQGLQFISAFMKELYRILGVEGNPSTPYRLQTDGQTERLNQELERYLQTYVNFQQDNWAEWLSIVEFTYNDTAHSATGKTPFYLNLGWHPNRYPGLKEGKGQSEAATSFID
jgi:hypothetical protein